MSEDAMPNLEHRLAHTADCLTAHVVTIPSATRCRRSRQRARHDRCLSGGPMRPCRKGVRETRADPLRFLSRQRLLPRAPCAAQPALPTICVVVFMRHLQYSMTQGRGFWL